MPIKIELLNKDGTIEESVELNNRQIRDPYDINLPQGQVMIWEAFGATGIRTFEPGLQLIPGNPDTIVPIPLSKATDILPDQGFMVFQTHGPQVVYVKTIEQKIAPRDLARITISPTEL